MIVLFTDFGLMGPYTGQVKAVLKHKAPEVPVVDLFADAPSRNPKASAYLLAAHAVWFPAGTVFVAVVDPGVGGKRPAVAVAADGRWFVGPANGLLEIVQRRATSFQLFEITWQPPHLSPSFHGRDLFAPVAASLAQGKSLEAEPRPTDFERQPEWPDDLAEIVYIDHYGNAMTGLRADCLSADAALLVAGRRILSSRTFSDVVPGSAFWYRNSNGLAEIAVNLGRADHVLGLAIGIPVGVEIH
jgi:S-adenosyl-L-methionine hydrolase (adenosine-forming)